MVKWVEREWSGRGGWGGEGGGGGGNGKEGDLEGGGWKSS